jgi:hypothetical protein
VGAPGKHIRGRWKRKRYDTGDPKKNPDVRLRRPDFIDQSPEQSLFPGLPDCGIAPVFTVSLFYQDPDIGYTVFTDHLPAMVAFLQVVCTDNSVADRAAEKTFLADIVIT